MINQVHKTGEQSHGMIVELHGKVNKIHDQLGDQNSILKLMCISLVVIAGLLAVIAWG